MPSMAITIVESWLKSNSGVVNGTLEIIKMYWIIGSSKK